MVGYAFRIDQYKLSFEECKAVGHYIKDLKKMALASVMEVGPTVSYIDAGAKQIFSQIRSTVDYFSDFESLMLDPRILLQLLGGQSRKWRADQRYCFCSRPHIVPTKIAEI